MATKLAELGFEGPEDIADLTEAEAKYLAGDTVTPLTAFADRARAFARMARDALSDAPLSQNAVRKVAELSTSETGMRVAPRTA